jgi:hypothetical protein
VEKLEIARNFLVNMFVIHVTMIDLAEIEHFDIILQFKSKGEFRYFFIIKYE